MFETSLGVGKRGSVDVEGHSGTVEQLRSQAVGHIPNQLTPQAKQTTKTTNTCLPEHHHLQGTPSRKEKSAEMLDLWLPSNSPV